VSPDIDARSLKTAGRLEADETASASEVALSALAVALGAIEAPSIVFDLRGTVLYANSKGSTLFEANPRAILQLFARSVAGAPNEGGWESIPLLGQEVSRRFLMILK
jgi:hypothetical protein